MKPIIMNIKDMSESNEIYKSKPNSSLVYFIYIILLVLTTSLVWMCYSKLDIVVKCNGVFHDKKQSVDVSSVENGIITECNVSEGKFVEAGDILFLINAEMLEMKIANSKQLLIEIEQRIDILQAYERYLVTDE